MLNFINLLTPAKGEATYNLYIALSVSMIALMAIAAIVAIILVLMQPSNSQGIDALGGSSETFFGKNKGKSIEAKMKKWTWICLIVLVVFSITFYILQLESIWA
jgi:preprotein translocase subunit SecG